MIDFNDLYIIIDLIQTYIAMSHMLDQEDRPVFICYSRVCKFK